VEKDDDHPGREAEEWGDQKPKRDGAAVAEWERHLLRSEAEELLRLRDLQSGFRLRPHQAWRDEERALRRGQDQQRQDVRRRLVLAWRQDLELLRLVALAR